MRYSLRQKTIALSAMAATMVLAAACAEDEALAPPSPLGEERDAAIFSPIDGGDGQSGIDGSPPAADAEVPTCSKEGWCRLPLPTNTKKRMTLDSVWGDGQGSVWAVSREGDILRWDGQIWSVARSGTDLLFEIWGSGPTDLWVTSATGILHGQGVSAASLTWTLTPLDALPGDPTSVLTTIGGTSAGDVWAAGGRALSVEWERYPVARVIHLSNGDGGAWALEPAVSTDPLPPDGASIPHWERVLATPTGEVYLFGRTSGRYLDGLDYRVSVKRRHRELDGMSTWVEVYQSIAPVGDYWSACGSLANWAGMYLDSIGANAPIATAAFGDRLWLASTGSSTASSYGVGTYDPVTRTMSWSCASFGYRDAVLRNGLFASSTSEAWAAGDFGRLNHYDGHTMKIVAAAPQLPITADLNDVWAGPSDVWAVGDDIALRKVKTP